MTRTHKRIAISVTFILSLLLGIGCTLLTQAFLHEGTPVTGVGHTCPAPFVPPMSTVQWEQPVRTMVLRDDLAPPEGWVDFSPYLETLEPLN